MGSTPTQGLEHCCQRPMMCAALRCAGVDALGAPGKCYELCRGAQLTSEGVQMTAGQGGNPASADKRGHAAGEYK